MLGETLCSNSVQTITLGNRCQNLQLTNNIVTELEWWLKKLIITANFHRLQWESGFSRQMLGESLCSNSVQTITFGNQCQNIQFAIKTVTASKWSLFMLIFTNTEHVNVSFGLCCSEKVNSVVKCYKNALFQICTNNYTWESVSKLTIDE